MSYEKQTWVTGDVITAEKLNHMEDGIDAELVIIKDNEGDISLINTTFNQIKAAVESGKLVMCAFEDVYQGTDTISLYYLVKLISTPGDPSSYMACFAGIDINYTLDVIKYIASDPDTNMESFDE